MQAGDDRHFQVDFFGGVDDAFGDEVASDDAAKDVHQDGFDFRRGEDELEGFFDALGSCAAANIKEVRRFAAVQFDDVHRGHRKAGAIDHAADVAIKGDVVQFEFLRLVFARVFLARVAHFGEVFVAVEGVVIDADFGIQRQQFAIAGDDERVDFDHRQVFVGKEVIEALQQGGELADLFFVQPHGKAEAAADVGEVARRRIDADAVDFFRAFFRDFFDVHAAFGAGDEGNAAAGAINHGGDVEFVSDIQSFFDEYHVDGQANFARLLGFQGVANHLAGVGAHFVQAFRDFDAACLAAPARVDLCLDDPDAAAQFLRGGDGFVGVFRQDAARGIHTVCAEERFRLILM